MSFTWLQHPYPRYLRAHSNTFHMQVHDQASSHSLSRQAPCFTTRNIALNLQEVNHLAFANSTLALQDLLVLSDGQARIKVYRILPESQTATCIWQVPHAQVYFSWALVTVSNRNDIMLEHRALGMAEEVQQQASLVTWDFGRAHTLLWLHSVQSSSGIWQICPQLLVWMRHCT